MVDTPENKCDSLLSAVQIAIVPKKAKPFESRDKCLRDDEYYAFLRHYIEFCLRE